MELPLFIVEYGQYERRPGAARSWAMERARAAAIRQDAEWIAAQPQIGMWMYWQGTGHRNGDWRMSDGASQAAWRELAFSGCAPAARCTTARATALRAD